MNWIALFEVLEARGFTVYRVNARHVKNVSGRQSDVLDCQWLQQLLSYGLLAGAFRPSDEVCATRAVPRQRDMLLSYQARHVQHMQKTLAQMNVQLANVISDIVGETGHKIVRAIVAGERNGQVLAKLKNAHLRASEEQIAQSLRGNWREEHLFALKQALALFDAYAEQLAQCAQQLHKMLTALERYTAAPGKPRRRPRTKNFPKVDVRAQLYRICGVDLTAKRWHRCPHGLEDRLGNRSGPGNSGVSSTSFPGWVGAPARKSQAAKCSHVPPSTSPIVLRQPYGWPRLHCVPVNRRSAPIIADCAHASIDLKRSPQPPTNSHDCSTPYSPKALQYVDRGQDYDEERYRQRILYHLNRKAATLGFILTPVTQAT